MRGVLIRHYRKAGVQRTADKSRFAAVRPGRDAGPTKVTARTSGMRRLQTRLGYLAAADRISSQLFQGIMRVLSKSERAGFLQVPGDDLDRRLKPYAQLP